MCFFYYFAWSRDCHILQSREWYANLEKRELKKGMHNLSISMENGAEPLFAVELEEKYRHSIYVGPQTGINPELVRGSPNLKF